MPAGAKILIVDDEPFNVDYLEQELDDLGYVTVSAGDGQAALDQVRAESPDLILLDIMMPIMDGFAVLGRLKADPASRDIPVIIISAMTDMASIVRGIELGADDYLPKPFEPVLLQARIAAGLDKKLRRDQELVYLRQVETLAAAAGAVQAGTYAGTDIDGVASRPDALGNLARVFQKMAGEVVAREQRLKRQIEQLQRDIEEQRSGAAETPAIHIPMDRRQALAHGTDLREQSVGAALFADISGFTALTEAYIGEFGPQRGAEEITRQIDEVHSVLIQAVHRFGGSVVGFSGDAITGWFDAATPAGAPAWPEAERRALASALEIQAAVRSVVGARPSSGIGAPIAVKVALAAGPARRMLVGDPAVQLIDVLAGRTLDELAAAQQLAGSGEIVTPAAFAAAMGDAAVVSEVRGGGDWVVLTGLNGPLPLAPWPDLAPDAVSPEQARPWLAPAVFDKVSRGQSGFLSELRPAVPIFVKFAGIDYDADPDASRKLDAFLRWVQAVLQPHQGTILQVTFGDKGSYLYVVIGAPVAHSDDPVRAVSIALQLVRPPAALDFLTELRVGAAYGQVRAGAYGAAAQRTYGALGDKTNLAARLMLAAQPGAILCDEALYEAAGGRAAFLPLPPIQVKGKLGPVPVYRPLPAPLPAEPSASPAIASAAAIDQLTPGDQLALKAASVLGRTFSRQALQAVYPEPIDETTLAGRLHSLCAVSLVVPVDGHQDDYCFVDAVTHQTAYGLMLYSQRRQLHRAAAEWHERVYAGELEPHYALLAGHWRAAEEPARAAGYYEKAGQAALRVGDIELARQFLNQSLILETQIKSASPRVN